jgi:hypothetical protein
MPMPTVLRAWRRARKEIFTDTIHASPLAKRPYDLRHAAVSTWLNGGVPPTEVAELAGQSVEVLLRIYAKCLDGGLSLLRQRIDVARGHQKPVIFRAARDATSTPGPRGLKTWAPLGRNQPIMIDSGR